MCFAGTAKYREDVKFINSGINLVIYAEKREASRRSNARKNGKALPLANTLLYPAQTIVKPSYTCTDKRDEQKEPT